MPAEPRIHLLPKQVAERIAAGEVVERPSSVLKELIENAIDAGATAISIELREGGVALIRVSDNGTGMTRAEALLSVQRFATSKITSETDLAQVRTLGFRGEALPSIATVSQLELLTRIRDEVQGTQVRVNQDQVQSEVAGAAVGTQVTVRNLFYNAPARLKFLKSPLRETELCGKTALLYALAYPHIAFRLVVDGRETFAAPASRPLERVGAVWGRESAGEMLELAHTNVDLSVTGFISRPTLARSSRDWQAFFVNGRPIRSGLLAVMLERPYLGRLPPNRHPLAFVQLQVDPQFIDVNVHPRKAEVRFFQERAIYGAVSGAVASALRDFPVTFSAGRTEWPFANIAPTDQAEPLPARESPSEYASGTWRALAQIHNTFLLAATPDGMVIVDQHAAQEQIFFELLTGAAPPRQTSHSTQLQVTAREAEHLLPHLEEYRSLGIELEPFGVQSFRITAVPEFIPLPPDALLTTLLEEHERHPGQVGDALRDRLAAKAACVSAVKAGDALTLPQQQALLDSLLRAHAPSTCPHGRPVFIFLGLHELERRFLRR